MRDVLCRSSPVLDVKSSRSVRFGTFASKHAQQRQSGFATDGQTGDARDVDVRIVSRDALRVLVSRDTGRERIAGVIREILSRAALD